MMARNDKLERMSIRKRAFFFTGIYKSLSVLWRETEDVSSEERQMQYFDLFLKTLALSAVVALPTFVFDVTRIVMEQILEHVSFNKTRFAARLRRNPCP
ncbi:hypothetical protein [Thalassospira mesophila]|uniref:hypothetical protein n=1 Tax=Thalassospira mesophila TaxID=1293891 RepID=UPI0011811B1D|nr:hypothetical protein [Thalassospira mesophila]